MLEFHCPGACVRRILGEMGPGARILDHHTGDVTGEGQPQDVYLVGSKPQGPCGIFCTGIVLVIAYRSASISITMPLDTGWGFDPRLFVLDFNGDGIGEICVSIFSGQRDCRRFCYIYGCIEGRPVLHFDHRQFNGSSRYEAAYRNFDTLEVRPRTAGGMWLLPLADERSRRLRIRYRRGILPRESPCRVDPLDVLIPQLEGDGNSWSLLAVQRISDCTDGETLGAVHTHLVWRDGGFEPRSVMAVGRTAP